uniref:Uncharacterized protein n=1 Tax=viral metagenome TaxID=1070528 RepID=A0A6C0DQM5_9ZZZZ
MLLSSLCNYLPQDIVQYVLEFDKNIVVRNGIIKIINKLDKQLYSESFNVLIKKPLPILGRTNRIMNKIYTWCTVKLRLDRHGEHYIDYSSGPTGVKCTLTFWGGTGDDNKINGIRRFEKTHFNLP